MNKENIKKVVLAYSGGLDTSTFIPAAHKTADSLSLNAVSTGVLSAFASRIRLRDTFLLLSFTLFHHTGLA